MAEPDWNKFDDQGGIDAKYRQAGKTDLGQVGPRNGTSVIPRDPSGSGLAEEPHVVAKGAPQAGAEDILHPTSPREDQQFAAIHDRQDDVRRKDSKAKSQPPSGR